MIPVYWLMQGTNEIHVSLLVEVTPDGEAKFEDGGWNRIERCFLTEQQCRDHHQLSPSGWTDPRPELAQRLEALAREILESR